MKALLWIVAIGAVIYYFVMKNTAPAAQISSAPSGGGGGFFSGLLGFGAGSPSTIDLGQGSSSTSNANTINQGAIGPLVTSFHSGNPGLQPRVIGPGPGVGTLFTPTSPITPTATAVSTPGATSRSAITTPVAIRSLPPVSTYGAPHYRAFA